MKRSFILWIALCCAAAAPAWAEINASSPLRGDYPSEASRKLGRGLSNVAFGWMDFLKGIEETGNDNGGVAQVVWGPINGLGKMVQRTAVGVVEVATFAIPAPNGFDPMLEPEFPGEYDRRI